MSPCTSPQPVMSQPYPVPIPLPQPKSRPLPDSRGIPDTLNLFFFGKHAFWPFFHCQVCDKEFRRATKSFDTILFVSSCKDKLEGYPFSLSLLHVFQFQTFLSKKAEFLITMRATKSFDTIILCLHVFKFQTFLSQKKAELLITMRAIKSLDYILFCLQMCS